MKTAFILFFKYGQACMFDTSKIFLHNFCRNCIEK